MLNNFINNQFKESFELKEKLFQDLEFQKIIQEICELAIATFKNGNKVILAGNGGSAADAQHIAAEFVSRFYFDRPGLPSIALTTDTSILTAIGNDYGYDRLFARQIQANGVAGDLFIGITTSGNSKNIIEAFKECKSKDIISVCLTGKTGGVMGPLCDHSINVPSDSTPRIQEAHILIGHIICAVVEEELFGKGF